MNNDFLKWLLTCIVLSLVLTFAVNFVITLIGALFHITGGFIGFLINGAVFVGVMYFFWWFFNKRR